jgi:hypothetical protein
LTGIDPKSGRITEVFHPRKHVWREHFRWKGVMVIGLMPTGRTTVDVLCMNSDEMLRLREALRDA